MARHGKWGGGKTETQPKDEKNAITDNERRKEQKQRGRKRKTERQKKRESEREPKAGGGRRQAQDETRVVIAGERNDGGTKSLKKCGRGGVAVAVEGEALSPCG